MDTRIGSQLVELNRLYKEAEEIYHDLARHFELSDSALWVLYALREAESVYTQRELCDMWSLSKQTIHSALKSLEAAGYIRLEPLADNLKSKQIVLTAAGEALMERSIDRIFRAEQLAFARLTDTERREFLHLYRKHIELLQNEMNQMMESSSEDL